MDKEFLKKIYAEQNISMRKYLIKKYHINILNDAEEILLFLFDKKYKNIQADISYIFDKNKVININNTDIYIYILTFFQYNHRIYYSYFNMCNEVEVEEVTPEYNSIVKIIKEKNIFPTFEKVIHLFDGYVPQIHYLNSDKIVKIIKGGEVI